MLDAARGAVGARAPPAGAGARRRRARWLVALVGASVWRLEQPGVDPRSKRSALPLSARAPAPQPRIVRADTYLAVAALEDHIASIDDALN